MSAEELAALAGDPDWCANYDFNDIPWFLAEVRCLRAALAEYADRSRWQFVAVPLANGNVRLCATFDGGWGVADAALLADAVAARLTGAQEAP